MKCNPRRWTPLGKRLKIFVKRKDQLRSFEIKSAALAHQTQDLLAKKIRRLAR
jgi:hypothetical protein